MFDKMELKMKDSFSIECSFIGIENTNWKKWYGGNLRFKYKSLEIIETRS